MSTPGPDLNVFQPVLEACLPTYKQATLPASVQTYLAASSVTQKQAGKQKRDKEGAKYLEEDRASWVRRSFGICFRCPAAGMLKEGVRSPRPGSFKVDERPDVIYPSVPTCDKAM